MERTKLIAHYRECEARLDARLENGEIDRQQWGRELADLGIEMTSRGISRTDLYAGRPA